jgi:hypothetical protein
MIDGLGSVGGMAEIDITPDFPVRLAGYAGRMDEANDVIARLSGKALAIAGDDGNGPAMLMPTVSAAGEDRATVPAGGHLRLRVLSYNIHHGEGVDRKLDLPRIASVTKSVKPDLVALQEVDQGTERTVRVDQPAELARLTGLNVVFGGNIRCQGGDYGNAVLSRLPISRHKNHLLPRFDDGEQGGVLQVERKSVVAMSVAYARRNSQSRCPPFTYIENDRVLIQPTAKFQPDPNERIVLPSLLEP